jgi:hypothetical protein
MDSKKRWIGAALALIAVGLVAVGAQTHAWWTGSSADASIGIGMRDVLMCVGDRCSTMAMGSLGADYESANWYRAGMASSVGALLACVLLLGMAGALAFGKRNALIAKVAVMACAVAGLTGVAYVATFPGHSGVGMGYSLFMYFGGIAAGVAAGITAKRAAELDVT